MTKSKNILKRSLGLFLLVFGIGCGVTFFGFPFDALKAGFPIFSFSFLFPMAIYAFLGYFSIIHGYYLLRYGKSREKVAANKSNLQKMVNYDFSDFFDIGWANSIVCDKINNLEWLAGPDKNTSWAEAESWLTELKSKGADWRMPTMDELNSIYKKGAGDRNMILNLKTTGWEVWSSKSKARESSKAWRLDFYDGRRRWFFHSDPSTKRAFAVRSIQA